MAEIPFDFLRKMPTPQVQVTGTNLTRQPNWGMDPTTITVIDDPTNARLLFSVNTSSLGGVSPTFSASVATDINNITASLAQKMIYDVPVITWDSDMAAAIDSRKANAGIGIELTTQATTFTITAPSGAINSARITAVSGTTATDITKLYASTSLDSTRIGTLSGAVAADVIRLNAKLDFTGSVSTLTFYNSAAPRHAMEGLISSGTMTSITAALVSSRYYEWSARVINRKSSPDYAVAYTKGLTGMIDTYSDVRKSIFENTTDDYFATSGFFSSSYNTSTNSLIVSFTSATGSSYEYGMYVNLSSLSF